MTSFYKATSRPPCDKKYLAAQLRKARLEHGWSANETANMLNMSSFNYYYYEKEQISKPSQKFLDKVTKLYSKEESYFYKPIYNDESTFPDVIKDWSVTPEAEPYIIEAYAKYLKEKAAKKE